MVDVLTYGFWYFCVCRCRGFRQATRGADTGAFHHPCFRRDQPELCLQMVCQKSRDRQQATVTSQVKRSLPPKKRSFVDIPTTHGRSSNKTMMIPSSPSLHSSAMPVSVSTDDRSIGNSSIASQGSSNDMTKSSAQCHPKVVVTGSELSSFSSSANGTIQPVAASISAGSTTSGVLPFVSNDSNFVASTLKQRDDQEVLRAAQAMLYEAFMQALQQQHKQQTSS